MSVYIQDLIRMIEAIQRKKAEKGYLNRDMDVKLQKIKEKVARAGGGGRQVKKEEIKEVVRMGMTMERKGTKMAGDEVSFDRPDSGTADEEEEEEEDEEESSGDDKLVQELEEEEEFDRKSRASRAVLRRKKTTKSKGSGGSHRTTKTFRTQKTTRT